MGAQKEITREIIGRGADYVVLKSLGWPGIPVWPRIALPGALTKSRGTGVALGAPACLGTLPTG